MGFSADSLHQVGKSILDKICMPIGEFKGLDLPVWVPAGANLVVGREALATADEGVFSYNSARIFC